MESILDQPQSGTYRWNYAGFWIRFVAALIDGIIISIIYTIIISLFGLYLNRRPELLNPEDTWVMMIFGFVFIFLSMGLFIVYHSLLESSPIQGSIGKLAVGLKVVNNNGERISFLKALGRTVSKFLSSLILLIGYIIAAFDSKKQALHDKLATTYVVYK